MLVRSLLATVAAAGMLLAGGCNAGGGAGAGQQVEVTRRVERAVEPGGRTLVLDGYSGSITLQDTSADRASLTFVKHARAADRNAARQLLSRVRIEERGGDEEFAYKLTSGAPSRTSVDVRGHLPQGTRLRVYLRNGEVALSGLRGPIDVSGENGNIRIGGAARDVRAETRNGSVEAGMRQVPNGSEVRLQTQNGDVQLTAPAATTADVEARTDAGTISLGGLRFSERQMKDGGAGARFEGMLGEGTETHIRLRTVNGDVRLRQGTVRRLEGVGRDSTARDSTAQDSTMQDTTGGRDSLFAPRAAPRDTSRPGNARDTTTGGGLLGPPRRNGSQSGNQNSSLQRQGTGGQQSLPPSPRDTAGASGTRGGSADDTSSTAFPAPPDTSLRP